MDARIDVFAALGLHLGEAHVIRNAGGRVTDDVLGTIVGERQTGCCVDTQFCHCCSEPVHHLPIKLQRSACEVTDATDLKAQNTS